MQIRPSSNSFPEKSSSAFNCDARVGKHPNHLRHYYIFLLPGSNMLDFVAAIEPLRVLNTVKRTGLYSWSVISETGGPVRCSNGIDFSVDSALPATLRTDCVIVCSGNNRYMDAKPETLHWLRRHVRFGGKVSAIATGAFTLARAGITSDTSVILHWSLVPVFEELFPELDCLNARTVLGRSVSYSAGGSSSLDLILGDIEADFGHETAQKVADFFLHTFDSNIHRPQRQTLSKRAGTRHPGFLKILKKMEDSIQESVPLEELIGGAAISRRQVERLFQRHFNTTPSRYFRNLRLDRARTLIHGTDMPVMDIAVATGFPSIATFSKVYQRHFGERPSKDRKAIE